MNQLLSVSAEHVLAFMMSSLITTGTESGGANSSRMGRAEKHHSVDIGTSLEKALRKDEKNSGKGCGLRKGISCDLVGGGGI